MLERVQPQPGDQGLLHPELNFNGGRQHVGENGCRGSEGGGSKLRKEQIDGPPAGPFDGFTGIASVVGSK